MTIFDQINSIAFTKKKIELNCDDVSQFSPFMVNRWLSFYSPEVAALVNDVTNRQFHTNDKQELYEYYYNLIPKLKYKKIAYIKKTKKEPTSKKEIDPHIPEFMSKKQYQQYVDFITENDI